MNYRNEALTRLAKGMPCTLTIPGVCNHDPETSAWAHSNQLEHGKGRGIKAHDCFGAITCYACHYWLDHGPASRKEKLEAFTLGMHRTWLMLWERGLIGVTGSAQVKERVPQRIPKILPRRFV